MQCPWVMPQQEERPNAIRKMLLKAHGDRRAVVHNRIPAARDRFAVADDRATVERDRFRVVDGRAVVARDRFPVADDRATVDRNWFPVAGDRIAVIDERFPVARDRAVVADERFPVAPRPSGQKEGRPEAAFGLAVVAPAYSGLASGLRRPRAQRAPTSLRRSSRPCAAPDSLSWP